MVQTYKSGNETIWYDSDLLSVPVEMCTNAPYWYVHNKVVGVAKGRGTTWFVQLANLQGALRHYRRGGLFGKLVSDQYCFQGWQKTRSYQEFLLLTTLRTAGVNVPRPIAARAVKTGLIYRADLLSEKVPNAHDLVDILQRQPLTKQNYYNIGQQIRKMHDVSVNHTDLNIHNILLDDEQNVWIIDFDKCTVQSGDAWKSSNLDRLKRSFFKEQGKRNIHWNENEWQLLLAGYSG
ncbi:3-deoxy-D-manno-octulosonic acid kinase [Vibrio sp. MA40-2]|uniref:3-deoxy-D-manno-octulosonic acid kinase n=1 Tax=Vibrio sp. MA40-2 TaxID=3391828 RepID=UPI0039A49DE8